MNEIRVSARECLRADLDRFYAHCEKPPNRFRRLRIALKTEGIWAISVFRFGQYLHHEANRLTRMVFMIPYLLSAKLMGLTVGIHLFPETRIGPGFYIGHYGGIWISPRATLGANCSIGQGVTIGVAGRDRSRGPALGDRVWVGPNATITGKVTIGSGAVVGANSLVTSNIPENGVALGVPARVISYTGSKSLIILPPQPTSQSD
jgi:serine O-acetyltransferase